MIFAKIVDAIPPFPRPKTAFWEGKCPLLSSEFTPWTQHSWKIILNCLLFALEFSGLLTSSECMSTQNKGPAGQWHGIDCNGDGCAFDLKEDNGKITGTNELCDSGPENASLTTCSGLSPARATILM